MIYLAIYTKNQRGDYIFQFQRWGLKNVEKNKKIASHQCSWIKRLYEDSFYE